MAGFIEGFDREQLVLFPDRLGDCIGADHPVRIIDAFVDALDLAEAGFQRASAARTGRPGYHPSVLLKLFVYGYMNRVPSSRLELEAARNIEVMWLTGRLVPDHKTIADFRKDNAAAIRWVCARFVELCRPSAAHAFATGHSLRCRRRGPRRQVFATTRSTSGRSRFLLNARAGRKLDWNDDGCKHSP